MHVRDLIPDWKRARAAAQAQIDLFEHGSGLNPPWPVTEIRAWIAEYDRLITYYSAAR
jgi:hypothetical protein